MDTETLVSQLTSNNQTRRANALNKLYSGCFKPIKAYVLQNSGSIPEAEDVFQETISKVYFNIINGSFRQESSIFYYTISIAKKIWISHLRKRKMSLVPLESMEDSAEETPLEVNKSLLLKVFERLSTVCQTVLIDFYFKEKTMHEIAKEKGLGSAQAAKTKKLRCMKKLSGFIEGSGLKTDDFFH